uniref:G_PROTEIN_RECEP_F1_2 domain-containing protein n=1 Tax=Macrostomum lignano TaxID=282301 RepID=A0A1I8IT64_9PLAT
KSTASGRLARIKQLAEVQAAEQHSAKKADRKILAHQQKRNGDNGVLVCSTRHILRSTALRRVRGIAEIGSLARISMPQSRHNWVAGRALCKAIPYLQGVAVAASVTTFSVIAFDRYLAICRPLKRHFSKKKTMCIICGIWMYVLLALSPWLIYHDLQTVPNNNRTYLVCINTMDMVQMKIYHIIVIFFLLYAGPCCLSLVATQRSSNAHDKKQMSRLVKMLATVVLIFAISWLPLHIVGILFYVSRELKLEGSLPLIQWVGISNCCVNPWIYCAFSQSYRDNFFNTLRCLASAGVPVRSNPVPDFVHRRRFGQHVALPDEVHLGAAFDAVAVDIAVLSLQPNCEDAFDVHRPVQHLNLLWDSVQQLAVHFNLAASCGHQPYTIFHLGSHRRRCRTLDAAEVAVPAAAISRVQQQYRVDQPAVSIRDVVPSHLAILAAGRGCPAGLLAPPEAARSRSFSSCVAGEPAGERRRTAAAGCRPAQLLDEAEVMLTGHFRLQAAGPAVAKEATAAPARSRRHACATARLRLQFKQLFGDGALEYGCC